MSLTPISRSSTAGATPPVAPTASEPTSARRSESEPPIDTSRDVAEVASRASTTPQTVAISAAQASRFVDVQFRHAAEAFARGGVGGLETWMREHRDEARWLLSVPRGELQSGLQAALRELPGYRDALGAVSAYTHAEAIGAHLASAFQPTLREAVRQTVVGRIDTMMRNLESASPSQLVQQLREAPAGSPMARLRETLGVRGDARDVERVTDARQHALEELRTLRDTVMGQTWMPEEFPDAMRQVQQQLGLSGCARDSIAGQAFYRRQDGLERFVHDAQLALEALHIAVEAHEVWTLAREALHATRAALPASETVASGAAAGAAGLATTEALALGGGLTASLAGLAFGVALHHQVQENRAERTEVAGRLGL